jgi:hypothetical protein
MAKAPSAFEQARKSFQAAPSNQYAAHDVNLKGGKLGASLREMGANMWNSLFGSKKYIDPTSPKTVDRTLKEAASQQKLRDTQAAKDAFKEIKNPTHLDKKKHFQALKKLNARDTAKVVADAGGESAVIGRMKKANIVEHVISKPLRWAAKKPRTAMAATAISGLLYMNHRHNRQQRLAELEEHYAPGAQPQEPAFAGGYYQNSVTPEEYAAMQAQMRDSGGQAQGGHAQRIRDQREAQAMHTDQQMAPSA